MTAPDGEWDPHRPPPPMPPGLPPGTRDRGRRPRRAAFVVVGGLLALAVATAIAGLEESPERQPAAISSARAAFAAAVANGSDCATLIAAKNELNDLDVYDPAVPEKLRSVGCTSVAATRSQPGSGGTDLYSLNYNASHATCQGDPEQVYLEAGTRDLGAAATWAAQIGTPDEARRGSYDGCYDGLSEQPNKFTGRVEPATVQPAPEQPPQASPPSVCEDSVSDSVAPGGIGDIRSVALDFSDRLTVRFEFAAPVPSSPSAFFAVDVVSADGNTARQLGVRFRDGVVANQGVFDLGATGMVNESVDNRAAMAGSVVTVEFPRSVLDDLGPGSRWRAGLSVEGVFGGDPDRCPDELTDYAALPDDWFQE